MKMGNIPLSTGFEPTILTMLEVAITLARFLDALTISTLTCLYDSFREREG